MKNSLCLFFYSYWVWSCYAHGRVSEIIFIYFSQFPICLWWRCKSCICSLSMTRSLPTHWIRIIMMNTLTAPLSFRSQHCLGEVTSDCSPPPKTWSEPFLCFLQSIQRGHVIYISHSIVFSCCFSIYSS